jgi:hypothetical protein
MEMDLESEELWALVNDAICLFEQIDPGEKQPGVQHWLKQAENLMMAKHRLGLPMGD